MLRHNLDIQDTLVNGACGLLAHIEADENTEIPRSCCVAIARRSQDCSSPWCSQRPTSIHKSQAATLHDESHSCLDATCKEEGQASVALSRAPHRPCASWPFTKGAAGRESMAAAFPIRPPENKDFYEQRLKEMGTPDCSRLKTDREDNDGGERPGTDRIAVRRLPTPRSPSRPTEGGVKQSREPEQRAREKPKPNPRPKHKPKPRKKPPPSAGPFSPLQSWESTLCKMLWMACFLPSWTEQTAPEGTPWCPANRPAVPADAPLEPQFFERHVELR